MTNGIAEAMPAVEMTPGVHWDGVFREPIPWAWFMLLTLWLVLIMVFISGIIVGITRRRKGQSSAYLSKRCILVSTCVLFLGSGVNLWNLASELGYVSSGAISAELRMPFMVQCICHSLYCLALNTILAGFGFVVGMVLKGNEHGNHTKAAQRIVKSDVPPSIEG